MLYIRALVTNHTDSVVAYKAYDTYSRSTAVLRRDLLTDILVNNKMQVVNASIQNNAIVIRNWVNGICTEKHTIRNDSIIEKNGPKYIALAKEGNSYRFIDSAGKMQYKMADYFKEVIKEKEVANCIITSSGEIESEDVYTIYKDKEFEKSIDLKYENYIAKAALLGYNSTTFNYEVENRTVRLTEYTGTNTEIILPSFITVIMKNAFRDKGIEKIELNEGLKVIGIGAFASRSDSASLERIEIPSTVELIGFAAFTGNDKLFMRDSNLSITRFKLRNSKTVMLRA